jgi:hypothetical protein
MSRSPSATRGLVTVLAGLSPLFASCDGSATPGSTTGPANQPPRFTSSPEITADHNREWSYRVTVTDPEGATVTLELLRAPAWLSWDPATATLRGLAGFANLGSHSISLRARDASEETLQGFALDVVPGEIFCDQDFGDPADSPYILPWRAGAEYALQQGNCNPVGGHVNWFAYDFDLAIGDTIIASRAGDVVAVREQFADGTRICGQERENLVFVQHDDGTIMAYIHLTTNGALVDVGDAVGQGDVIALSGDSGCSAGPHLHVALFAAERTGFDRYWSLPVNYSNASGPLDGQRQLVRGGRYRALP